MAERILSYVVDEYDSLVATRGDSLIVCARDDGDYSEPGRLFTLRPGAAPRRTALYPRLSLDRLIGGVGSRELRIDREPIRGQPVPEVCAEGERLMFDQLS